MARRAGEIEHHVAGAGVPRGDVRRPREFAQALAAYQESLELGDPAVQAEVLNGIGECLLELDRVDEAVAALTTARDLGAERGADYSLIYTYAFLGTAYARQRQWSRGDRRRARSLELALESDSKQSQQNAYLRLAETLLAKGDLPRHVRISHGHWSFRARGGTGTTVVRAADGLDRTGPLPLEVWLAGAVRRVCGALAVALWCLAACSETLHPHPRRATGSRRRAQSSPLPHPRRTDCHGAGE